MKRLLQVGVQMLFQKHLQVPPSRFALFLGHKACSQPLHLPALPPCKNCHRVYCTKRSEFSEKRGLFYGTQCRHQLSERLTAVLGAPSRDMNKGAWKGKLCVEGLIGQMVTQKRPR